MINKILILYACSGSLGHKVIAQNYYALLNSKGYLVTVEDVYELDKKSEIEFGKSLYFAGLKKAPHLWRWLYFHWQEFPFADWFRTVILPSRFKETRRLIKLLKPDLIITTHPTATSVVNRLKASEEISVKLITVFSDWHVQKFWIFPEVNKYLVVTDDQKAELEKINIPKNNISVTGILLSEEYYQAKTKSEARKLLGLPIEDFFVIVMGGGIGWGIEEILNKLKQIEQDFRVIVIGANKQLKKKIEHWANLTGNFKNKMKIYDFIEPSLYFAASDLIISKPGGLTTSQAFLLKLPFLASSPQPGHEEENLKTLEKYQVVISTKKKCFLEILEQLFEDKEKLIKISENAYNLAPIKAREKIIETIDLELQKQ